MAKPPVIKSISVYFDDNTRVDMTGNDDKIIEILRGRNDIRGFALQEPYPKGGWDREAIAKIKLAERKNNDQTN